VSGGIVRLDLAILLAPVMDELALAYAADPEGVGRLLAAHAGHVVSADVAAVTGAPHWEVATVAAAANGTRGALLGQSMTACRGFGWDLTPDAADALARRLHYVAAEVRQTGETR
jgi:pyrimidine deaminase RibD-like protein